jgi:hypothetical protein
MDQMPLFQRNSPTAGKPAVGQRVVAPREIGRGAHVTAHPLGPDGAHDDPDAVVRLVRLTDGPAYPVVLRGAVLPWVLRARHLVRSDLE